MIAFLIVGLLIGGAAVAFVLQNITPITVTFIIWKFSGSLAMVILSAIFSGALVSTLVSLPSSIKKGLQISNLTRRNSKLEKELADKKIEVESERPNID